MEPDRVLGALAEHWNDVRRTVGEERSRALAGLLRGDGDPARRRAELIDRLREWLDRDHPVRQAIRRHDADRSTALDLDSGAALAALTAAEDPGAAGAKRLLLAAEHYTPERVRALGWDPEQPGLLRLPGPDGAVVLPAFQFARGPRDDVIAVNLILHADTDPWGAADWWLRENAWLEGRPCDLIGDERLIAAARAVEGGD